MELIYQKEEKMAEELKKNEETQDSQNDNTNEVENNNDDTNKAENSSNDTNEAENSSNDTNEAENSSDDTNGDNSDIAQQIAELYIATFNRAPDEAGLEYWVGRYKDGMSIEQIAESFFDQPETIELYGDEDLDVFIDSVYENVLDRAPDKAGADYWKAELSSGKISKDKFIIAILNGAKEHEEDREHLENKTGVGMKFVEEKLNDPELAKLVIEDYKKTGDATAVKEAISEFAQNHSHQNKFGDSDYSEFNKSAHDFHTQHAKNSDAKSKDDFSTGINNAYNYGHDDAKDNGSESEYSKDDSTHDDGNDNNEVALVGAQEQNHHEDMTAF